MVLILADNQDITRLGIAYIAGSSGLFSEVKEAPSKKELVSWLANTHEAVVVLDYTLFDLSADYLMVLSQRFKKVQWILFSDQLSEDFVRRIVFSNNMFSIVMKDGALTEIEEALQLAVQARQFICSSFASWQNTAEKEEKETGEISPLTSTEKEILKAMALGKSTKEIAAQRFLSPHTVMTHRKNIFRKLGVNNVHEATKYALRAGILNTVEYYI